MRLVIQVQFRADQFPTLLHVALRSRHAEIIDVDHKQQLQFIMPEEAVRRLDRLEPNLLEVLVRFVFPSRAGVGMPIQSVHQRNHWVFDAVEMIRPVLFW